MNTLIRSRTTPDINHCAMLLNTCINTSHGIDTLESTKLICYIKTDELTCSYCAKKLFALFLQCHIKNVNYKVKIIKKIFVLKYWSSSNIHLEPLMNQYSLIMIFAFRCSSEYISKHNWIVYNDDAFILAFYYEILSWESVFSW